MSYELPETNMAPAGCCSAWFAGVRGSPVPSRPGTWGWSISPSRLIVPVAFGVDARFVSGAASLVARPGGSIGLGSVFGPLVGDDRLPRMSKSRSIPFGRLVPLPTPRRTPLFRSREKSVLPASPIKRGPVRGAPKCESAPHATTQTEKPAARPRGPFILSHSRI